jgi:hypothetical protein
MVGQLAGRGRAARIMPTGGVASRTSVDRPWFETADFPRHTAWLVAAPRFPQSSSRLRAVKPLPRIPLAHLTSYQYGLLSRRVGTWRSRSAVAVVLALAIAISYDQIVEQVANGLLAPHQYLVASGATRGVACGGQHSDRTSRVTSLTTLSPN